MEDLPHRPLEPLRTDGSGAVPPPGAPPARPPRGRPRRLGWPPMEGLPRRPLEPLSTDGSVAVPRQAATVVLMRGGDERLEVLLVQRTHSARFMAGVWVFPGGAVDAHEGEG